MAEVVNVIKLQIEAGKASPAPPVGTVLGPAGINLQDFCTKYNEATRDKMGDILPVEIKVYEDRINDVEMKYAENVCNLKMKEDEFDNIIMIIQSMLGKKADKFEQNIYKISSDYQQLLKDVVKKYKMFK